MTPATTIRPEWPPFEVWHFDRHLRRLGLPDDARRLLVARFTVARSIRLAFEPILDAYRALAAGAAEIVRNFADAFGPILEAFDASEPVS